MPSPDASCTVWIVDDDEDDQEFIRSAFLNGNPSIQSFLVNDGNYVVPSLLVCAQLPRLILLDINMPLKNGFETLAELRSIPAYADLPVIMLTTSSTQEDQQRALELGANGFLTKPVTFDQLRQLAQELTHQWALR